MALTVISIISDCVLVVCILFLIGFLRKTTIGFGSFEDNLKSAEALKKEDKE